MKRQPIAHRMGTIMDRKAFLKKMGIASGAVALFGLTKTTPARAAVLDNTSVKAADVAFEKESGNTNLQTEVTQLNISMMSIPALTISLINASLSSPLIPSFKHKGFLLTIQYV